MNEQMQEAAISDGTISKARLALSAIAQRILVNQRVLKIAALLLLAFSTLSMCNFTRSALRTYELTTLSDEAVQVILSEAKQPTRSAAYHELLAERALRLEIPDTFSAQENILKALEISPNSPYAWAHLAYIQTVRAGSVTPSAVQALEQSVKRCLYCDSELIKFRLEYILANWLQLSDELHAVARQHAEILKADPSQHEYLRDIIIRAHFLDIDLGIETHTLNIPGIDNG